MDQNIPLALTAAAAASVLFAVASQLQHGVATRQAAGADGGPPLSLTQVAGLLRARRWQIGLVLAGVATFVNFVALSMAPVSVVQPIGVLSVVWAVLLTERTLRRRVPPTTWVAVAITIAGAVVFTVVSSRHAAPETLLDPWWRIPLACLVAYLFAAVLGFWGVVGRQEWRCFLWASGAAVFYGVESALVRSLVELVREPGWLQDPLLPFLVVAAIAGALMAAWMVQQSYASGPAEVVISSVQVTNPLVAVLFGVAVLGEGVRLTTSASAQLVLAGLVAVLGVVMLSLVRPRPDADVAPPRSDHAA